MADNVDFELKIKADVIESLLRRLRVKNQHDITNSNSLVIDYSHSSLRNPGYNFDPRVVSIGPLHMREPDLKPFEARKLGYLEKLMHRVQSKKPGLEPLLACVQKVASSIDRIWACYNGGKNHFDKSELTEVMVMDACFILEFINQISDQSFDPGNMLLAQSITYDLVLLENQIPFFVLNDVFQCTMHHLEPDTLLTEFVHPLLKRLNLFQTELKLPSIRTDDHDHILGLLLKCYQPHDGYNIRSGFSSFTIRSAIELDRAGVNFKPNVDRGAQWPMGMDVKVHRIPCCSWSWRKTTFRIPALRINHFTPLVLRNLIAYEQSSSLVPNYITSYALAMDMLIDTQDDIVKLVESKVLINHISSNEYAADIINSICRKIAWVDFFYTEQWEELDRHCNSYWPRNIAWMKRTYFSNPWSIIALFAGIALFALTVVQTYFTVMSAGSNK